jgi:PAS domain-containing protein
MFDLSGVGIAFVRHGVVQRANSALARLLGYSEMGLLGLPWSALAADTLPADSSADHHAINAPLDLPSVTSDQDWTRECLLRHAAGGALWF